MLFENLTKSRLLILALASFVPRYVQSQSRAEDILGPVPYSINITYPSNDNFSRQLDFEDGGLMYAGVFGTHSPNIRTFTATQIVATPLRTNVTEEVWSSTYGITDIGNSSTIREGPLYNELALGRAFSADLDRLAEGRPFCKEKRDAPGFSYFPVANTSNWDWDASRDGLKFNIRQMVFTGSCGVEEVGNMLCIYPPFSNYSARAVWTATRRPGSTATIQNPAPSQNDIIFFQRDVDAYGNPQGDVGPPECGAAASTFSFSSGTLSLVIMSVAAVTFVQ